MGLQHSAAHTHTSTQKELLPSIQSPCENMWSCSVALMHDLVRQTNACPMHACEEQPVCVREWLRGRREAEVERKRVMELV